LLKNIKWKANSTEQDYRACCEIRR